ncbi:MAG: Zn-dependent protease/CBS domain-containing protein [Halobacteriales archaeon]|jgi:Zn-dependent protease/CBS domain-containing protein
MRSFRIGSAVGIPIKLDLTFLLILPIFAYLIGSQIEATADLLNSVWASEIAIEPVTTGLMPWIVGVVAALGLFGGVVLHELGHSLVAMRFDVQIDAITLWIFGGIASMEEIPEDWRQELAISVAGPIVSVFVGVVCYVAFLGVPSGLAAIRFVLGYLAVLNVVLAIFNMLPGFPMDGGRVLRALLARTRPYARATQIAAEVGKAFAILLGLWGLFSWSPISIGIAFFIYIGAASEAKQVTLKAAFEGVTVRDVMTPSSKLHTVSPETSIADLVERMFRERHTGYPVVDGGDLVGLITLDDAQAVQPVEREAFEVRDVMTTELKTIELDADAMAALESMQKEGIGRLLVTDRAGNLVGLISRSDLMTAFDIIRSSGSLQGEHRPGSGTDGGQPRGEGF